jgi:hypothetical protein
MNSYLKVSELKLVPNNLLMGKELCTRAGGSHSQHLLSWYVLLHALFTLRNAHWVKNCMVQLPDVWGAK